VIVFGQVRLSSESPIQVTVTEPQLSEAVTRLILGAGTSARHASIKVPGQPMVGGITSSRVIVCTQVLELPQLSVAVHVREMPELPVHPPGVVASEYVMEIERSQLSVAVAKPVLAGSVELPQASVIFGGQLITGAVISCTVIVWLQVTKFPHRSVACQVLVIVKVSGHVPGVITSV